MNLWIEDNEPLPAVKYNTSETELGYTKTIDPVDWNVYYNATGAEYINYRNDMTGQFEPLWDLYSDDQKRALVENYIYPSETSVTELDDLYAPEDRSKFAVNAISRLNILTSISTESDKYFTIQVNDSGILNGVEITTDGII